MNNDEAFAWSHSQGSDSHNHMSHEEKPGLELYLLYQHNSMENKFLILRNVFSVYRIPKNTSAAQKSTSI
jgi:hypothetical protein